VVILVEEPGAPQGTQAFEQVQVVGLSDAAVGERLGGHHDHLSSTLEVRERDRRAALRPKQDRRALRRAWDPLGRGHPDPSTAPIGASQPPLLSRETPPTQGVEWRPPSRLDGFEAESAEHPLVVERHA